MSTGLDLDTDLDAGLATGLAWFSDDELTAQSLAADPDLPIAADAVPLAEFLAIGRSSTDGSDGPDLPEWYMPIARGRGGRRHLLVISVIILALLVVVTFGYCITYGSLVIA